MLKILQSGSDDQTALIGCAVALVSAGAVLALSYYLSPARRQGITGESRTVTAPQTLRHPEDRAA